MPKEPSAVQLIQFLNDNADRYKNNPEEDGFNPTKEITSELTRVSLVDNPVPQPTVPVDNATKAINLRNMFPPSLISNFADEAIVQLNDAVRDYDFESIRIWAKVALERGKINAGQLAAVEAKIDETVLDPDWSAEVEGVCDLDEQWPEGEKGITQAYINQILGR